MCSCGEPKVEEEGRVIPPSSARVLPYSDAGVIVKWKDNSDNESGFSILMRVEGNQDEKVVGSVGENVQEFVMESGLEYDTPYEFGVRADSKKSPADNSLVAWTSSITIEDPTPPVVIPDKPVDPEESFEPKLLDTDTSTPEVKVPEDETSLVKITEIFSTESCVSISYTYDGLKGVQSCGICWDWRISPDISLKYQAGPKITAVPKVRQVITNVLLDYGKEYKFRAYVKTSDGKVHYSTSATCQLKDAPEVIQFEWEKIEDLGLPESVRVFKTEDKLNGRNFNAWCAIADMSKGDVEFKVVWPENNRAKTVDDQFAANSKAVLMTNAGYFYYTSGANVDHVGIKCADGVVSGDISSLYGPPNTSGQQYFATRAVFGVDANGKPGVYWSGNGWAAPKVYRFFDRPLPSVSGDDNCLYAEPTAELPAKQIEWEPQFMVSGFPVLLKNRKCPFDFTETESGEGYYLTNYEMAPYDIFGKAVRPDRTAVGYTKDGKIIIFICDGRISASGGAKLDELAQIMRGLGCVDAINLDGGGSTAMIAGGHHLNYYNPDKPTSDGLRPVYTCIGFFKK